MLCCTLCVHIVLHDLKMMISLGIMLCPISVADWVLGHLWSECGESDLAAAKLASAVCMVNQVYMMMMHLIYFVTVDIS